MADSVIQANLLSTATSLYTDSGYADLTGGKTVALSAPAAAFDVLDITMYVSASYSAGARIHLVIPMTSAAVDANYVVGANGTVGTIRVAVTESTVTFSQANGFSVLTLRNITGCRK